MRLAFDRGTILLVDPPSALDAETLPGALWDGRVGRWRAPGCAYPALQGALVRRGVAFEDSVRPALRPPGPWEPVPLRPYQEEALEAWEAGGKCGIVVLPTGSGKTVLGIAAAARAGATAIFLVPTRVLLQQWHAELTRRLLDGVGRLGDGILDVRPVTVATYESAWRHMAVLGARFDLLVVDEAHHFGNGLRDESLEMSVARARLGLTATPPPGGEGAARLRALLGPVVYELGIRELSGKWLARFDHVTLPVDLDLRERSAYEAEIGLFRSAHGEFRRREPLGDFRDFLRHAGQTEEGRRAILGWRRARAIVALPEGKQRALRMLLERHRGSRVLVFTADNPSAYRIAREHWIMPLTCEIGRKEREEALARFRIGELTALVSSRVLNEGLDVPDADVGIVVGGAQGEREHVQRVGRLLRPAPGKRAVVYEIVCRDTHEFDEARRRRAGLARGAPSPA